MIAVLRRFLPTRPDRASAITIAVLTGAGYALIGFSAGEVAAYVAGLAVAWCWPIRRVKKNRTTPVKED